MDHEYDSCIRNGGADSTSIIAPVKGLMQVFREAVEIKKHIHQNVALNRDTGENFDRFQIHLQIYVPQSNKISDNNLPGKQLIFKSAVSKTKLWNVI